MTHKGSLVILSEAKNLKGVLHSLSHFVTATLLRVTQKVFFVVGRPLAAEGVLGRRCTCATENHIPYGIINYES